MRLPLATLEIFTAIAQQGSLRGAADILGIKPSTVSHQLKALEAQLGKALFIRTTRSVNLTEAGQVLLRGAAPAFEQLVEAYENAQTTGHVARGRLRLAMPEFVYHILIGPALRSFNKAYPEIEIELSLSDALSDILEEGLHAGFRLGDRISEDMIAIRMTSPMAPVIAASTDYLEQHGNPVSPRDLLNHQCIRYRFQPSGLIAPWNFAGSEGDYTVDVTGSYIVNALPASIDLAVQGLGLVYTFRDLVVDQIDSGKLVSVLNKYLSNTPGIYIYFPSEYRSMLPLRLFLDHLKQ
ncbi:MAG: LysR family transcriptional regulator [Pseudomonadota bacterium]